MLTPIRDAWDRQASACPVDADPKLVDAMRMMFACGFAACMQAIEETPVELLDALRAGANAELMADMIQAKTVTPNGGMVS